MIFGNVRKTALWGFKLKKPCTSEWQRKFPEFKQIWISFLCGWGTLTWEDIGWVELEVCTTGASLTEKCRNIPALVNQLSSDICHSAWHWALGTEHLDPPGSTNSNSSSAEALTQTDSTWWTSLRTKNIETPNPKNPKSGLQMLAISWHFALPRCLYALTARQLTAWVL